MSSLGILVFLLLFSFYYSNMPSDTQVPAFINFLFSSHNKKTWVSTAARPLMRSSETLQVDEQSDTHEGIAEYPHSVRRRQSLHAHSGIYFQHTRGIKLCIIIDLHLKFPRFHQPIDKASCDAFSHYVVLN